MAWSASVAKIGHNTSGLTTTITFRISQSCNGSSYNLSGWRINYNSSTGMSGYWDASINKNSTITRDVSVSVQHDGNTGIAPNVVFTATNLIEGEYISNKVSKSASFQPPAVNVGHYPPGVSNLQLKRISDSQLRAQWTNNGSGSSAPTKSKVEIRTDNGVWVNVYEGALKSYYDWTGAAPNHAYYVRVRNGNSAGEGYPEWTTAPTYTSPATLKTFNEARAIRLDNKYSLSVDFDISNTAYPSNKIELQYSRNGNEWYGGTSGSVNGVYTFNTNGFTKGNLQLIDSQMGTHLKQFISYVFQGSWPLYLRARVYVEDNTLASPWCTKTTVQAIKYDDQNFPSLNVSVPNASSPVTMSIRVPSTSTIPAVYIKV